MGHNTALLAAAGAGGGGGIDPATLSPFCQLIAGNITGFNDGDTINTAWPDSSGNGHTFNPTGGVTFETNEFNGEAVVRFDGSTGFFTTAEAVATWDFLFLSPAESTVFVVFKIRLEHPGNNQAILDSAGISSSSRGYSLYYRDTGAPLDDAAFLGIFRGSAGNAVVSLIAEGGITTQAVQIMTAIYGYNRAGDDGEIIVNGASVGSAETLNAPAGVGSSSFGLLIGRYVLGAGLDLDADAAEICIFDKLLTPTERAGVESFYADKYGA
jgi:hypothetical protein